MTDRKPERPVNIRKAKALLYAGETVIKRGQRFFHVPAKSSKECPQ